MEPAILRRGGGEETHNFSMQPTAFAAADTGVGLAGPVLDRQRAGCYIAILIVVSVVAAIAVLDRPKEGALCDPGGRH